MASVNSSFVSPPSDSTKIIMEIQKQGFLRNVTGNLSLWTVLLGLFVAAVIYDQGE